MPVSRCGSPCGSDVPVVHDTRRSRRSRTSTPCASRHSTPKLEGRALRQTKPRILPPQDFIRVVARIRPKLSNEARLVEGVECLPDGRTVLVTGRRGEVKQFAVDQVFDRSEGSQARVFECFGQDLVSQSLRGYNVCVLAYGHTGSGKTYTMLGDTAQPTMSDAGLLPRFLIEIFKSETSEARYSCEYYEVYNEQIKDLLLPSGAERTRKVHVHPKHGVQIENLTKCVVRSAEEALRLLNFGNQMRAMAATAMNARSSRSHAIFTLKFEGGTHLGTSCQSTVTLVDLAGRENQSVTKNVMAQFREMCSINTSLFHLARLISKLSEGSAARNLSDFRNSKLTLLLSPALIGNSRTTLVATVAPVRSYCEDSISTLNFAACVKKIQTRPIVNDKAPHVLVAELEAEVRQLQKELAQSKTHEAEKEQALHCAQLMIESLQQSWEEAVAKSEELKMSRTESLVSLGLADTSGVPTGEVRPFFTKLCDDPLLQGRCNYFLKQSLCVGSNEDCDIVLHGLGMSPRMCEVSFGMDGVEVTLLGSVRVLVNGKLLLPSTRHTLVHGDCLFLGYSHAFRLVAATPEQVQKAGGNALVLARMTVSLDVATAVAETADTGAAFAEVAPFVSHLSTRAPRAVVEALEGALHSVCPLLDEVNVITSEVWGDDCPRFQLHALTDMFNFASDEPELVVCVLQSPKPPDNFRCRKRCSDNVELEDVIQKEDNLTMDLAKHPMADALGLAHHMKIRGDDVLFVWSLEKFLWRLSSMREVYHEGVEDMDDFASIRQHLSETPSKNPWQEIEFCRSSYPVRGVPSPRSVKVSSTGNAKTDLSMRDGKISSGLADLWRPKNWRENDEEKAGPPVPASPDSTVSRDSRDSMASTAASENGTFQIMEISSVSKSHTVSSIRTQFEELCADRDDALSTLVCVSPDSTPLARSPYSVPSHEMFSCNGLDVDDTVVRPLAKTARTPNFCLGPSSSLGCLGASWDAVAVSPTDLEICDAETRLSDSLLAINTEIIQLDSRTDHVQGLLKNLVDELKSLSTRSRRDEASETQLSLSGAATESDELDQATEVGSERALSMHSAGPSKLGSDDGLSLQSVVRSIAPRSVRTPPKPRAHVPAIQVVSPPRRRTACASPRDTGSAAPTSPVRRSTTPVLTPVSRTRASTHEGPAKFEFADCSGSSLVTTAWRTRDACGEGSPDVVAGLSSGYHTRAQAASSPYVVSLDKVSPPSLPRTPCVPQNVRPIRDSVRSGSIAGSTVGASVPGGQKHRLIGPFPKVTWAYLAVPDAQS